MLDDTSSKKKFLVKSSSDHEGIVSCPWSPLLERPCVLSIRSFSNWPSCACARPTCVLWSISLCLPYYLLGGVMWMFTIPSRRHFLGIGIVEGYSVVGVQCELDLKTWGDYTSKAQNTARRIQSAWFDDVVSEKQNRYIYIYMQVLFQVRDCQNSTQFWSSVI